MTNSKRRLSKKKIAKILAAAGIIFHGVASADAAALAGAIQSGLPVEVHRFITTYSDSKYLGDAVIYLASYHDGGGGGRGHDGGGGRGNGGGGGHDGGRTANGRRRRP